MTDQVGLCEASFFQVLYRIIDSKKIKNISTHCLENGRVVIKWFCH